MSSLSIYKASAGSGKTFRLTVTYLKIILAQPTHYKKILAITFTNKATAEMKSRILEQLHELSQGAVSAYQGILSEELQLSVQEVQQRAKRAEQYILHDYSRFSVMTIDAFFQTILKAFAKELGVSYNYNVELDTERIKRLAVERLFSELDDNKTLRRWLREYAKDKIDEGRSWNITNDILHLSKELFQEEFFLMNKEQFAQWSDKDFTKGFSAKLQMFINSYEKQLQELGQKAMTLIHENGLQVDDFSRKAGGVAGLFQRLTNGQVFVAITSSYHHKPLDNLEAWYTKTAPAFTKQQIAVLYPKLNEYLRQIHELVAEKGGVYQGCLMVRQNLHMMGIFSDIAKHIYEILHEEEKILLSESNKLLYEMIANNEVPFIYEKTGSQYMYFLWDEFQDTSQMQWHNLKPLLANALAEGNPCLIVGDVKQAIYRWRNSDWQILGEQLSVEFPEAKTISMTQNWRSDENIIAFNNALYEKLPQMLEKRLGVENAAIPTLYEDAEQQCVQQNATGKGFVHFSYLTASEELTDEEVILQELPKWVEKLQQSGVKVEDIVFLVRKNSEAVAIADVFANLEEKKEGINYDVVSEYALLLENAFVVKVLVNALHFFRTQEEYYSTFLEKLMPYLPEGDLKLREWKQWCATKKCCNSLDRLVQSIIRIFALHKLNAEQLYLIAFEEFVNTHLEKGQSNLADFLSEWEEKRHQLSVTPGERIPAMRVMTVHKAKGLEFHTVILPFPHKNIETYRTGETFWQEAEIPPFDGVGALLLPFTKSKLQQSNFAAAYTEEMRQRYIDELNVLYVATTRAVSNLVLLAPEKNNGVRITDLLYELVSNTGEDSFFISHWNEALRQWNYGVLSASTSEQQNPISYKQGVLHYHDYLKRFPLRMSSVDDAKRETVSANTPIEDGKIWHRLLESIRYAEDISVAVRRAYYSGIITANAQQNYVRHLKELVGRNTIKLYYTKDYEVWNERSIWVCGETYIPDRVVSNATETVVIEYKFGESQTSSHKKQLEKYIQIFRDKGHTNVKGFLIYGIFSEIIAV